MKSGDKPLQRQLRQQQPQAQLERPEFDAFSKFKGDVPDGVINIDRLISKRCQYITSDFISVVFCLLGIMSNYTFLYFFYHNLLIFISFHAIHSTYSKLILT
jgi:hypothetical protein